VVRVILSDGTERVLSVPLLLDIAATINSTNTITSANNTTTVNSNYNHNHQEDKNQDGGMIASVSKNLLKLLAFRRFAILPDDSDRSQLFVKDRSVSVAVMIAQMRNENYLNRNKLLKK
jgi:hypothetical protein